MRQIVIACEKLFEQGFLPSEAVMDPAEYFMIVGVRVFMMGAVVRIKKEMHTSPAIVKLDSVLHETAIALELSLIGYSMVE